MGCAAVVAKAITNTCTDVPSAGLELTAYIFNRLDATFTVDSTDANLITAIALTASKVAYKVTAVKKENNAGFDLVTGDNIPNLFTHMLALQPYERDAASIKALDTMDDFVAVVEIKAPKTEGKFVILGLNSGLHLNSVSGRYNDNYGIPTYEFATREGEAEVYSRYAFWNTGYAESKSALEALSGEWYGIKFTTTQSDPDGERMASSDSKMSLHASLPVQSLIKGCLLNDNGTVNYYLDADDWSLKEDGVTASVLAGTDGQVMVEVPEHYYKEWIDGTDKKIAISLTFFSGSTKVPKFYYGAYKAALNRTNNKLGSVVNTSADWRGGNNNAALDLADNSLLGKPATDINRTNCRTYAANRGAGWYQLPQVQASVIYRLFIIEHATRHSQKAVNAVLTAEGYRQGGLGNGVTTVASDDWDTFSSYYPFVPNGSSDSLGSKSGEVDYVVTGWPVSDVTVKVNRYRGIEQPFGHIWEWREGINIYNDHLAGTFKAYIIDDPANFADDTIVGAREAADLPQSSDYISEQSIGDRIAVAVGEAGSGSSTFFADYFYSGYSDVSTFFRALLAGGAANRAGYAGFACSHSLTSATSAEDASAYVGSRLCYL